MTGQSLIESVSSADVLNQESSRHLKMSAGVQDEIPTLVFSSGPSLLFIIHVHAQA